jgi:hypothetical protein
MSSSAMVGKNNRVSLEIVDQRNGHVDLPYFVDLKKWTCNLMLSVESEA